MTYSVSNKTHRKVRVTPSGMNSGRNRYEWRLKDFKTFIEEAEAAGFTDDEHVTVSTSSSQEFFMSRSDNLTLPGEVSS